jgi:serine/threonine protein kinase
VVEAVSQGMLSWRQGAGFSSLSVPAGLVARVAGAGEGGSKGSRSTSRRESREAAWSPSRNAHYDIALDHSRAPKVTSKEFLGRGTYGAVHRATIRRRPPSNHRPESRSTTQSLSTSSTSSVRSSPKPSPPPVSGREVSQPEERRSASARFEWRQKGPQHGQALRYPPRGDVIVKRFNRWKDAELEQLRALEKKVARLRLLVSAPGGAPLNAFRKRREAEWDLRDLRKDLREEAQEKVAEFAREREALLRVLPICKRHAVCYVGNRIGPSHLELWTKPVGSPGQFVALTTAVRNQALSAVGRAKVAWSLIDAMRAMHGLNVAHRDITPNNVLVNPATGSARLIDFGFACHGKACEENQLKGTMAALIPQVLAPYRNEVPVSLDQNKEIDVYSLGLTLVSMYSDWGYWKQLPKHEMDQTIERAIHSLALEGGPDIQPMFSLRKLPQPQPTQS